MTESTMIDRVARALHARHYGEWYEGPLKMTDSQRACLADARAAIETMKDPPFDILGAMFEAMFEDKWNGSQAPMIGAGWDAGIDAALNENKHLADGVDRKWIGDLGQFEHAERIARPMTRGNRPRP